MTTRLLSPLALFLALAVPACIDDGPAPPGASFLNGGDGMVQGDGMTNGDLSASAPTDAITQQPDVATPPQPDMTCLALPQGACRTCLANKCNTEYSACYGASWQTMLDPKSPCSPVYECHCTCGAPPNDGAIPAGCAACTPPMLSLECQGCSATATTCLQKNCATECK